ncbi:MAG: hypothetical protein ACI97A_002962 [Planctomycetota bacterium]|jgi:hypothetical protein
MIREIDLQMSSLLASATVPRERKRLVYQFGELLREVESVVMNEETPDGTRPKAIIFLEVLSAKEALHRDEFLLEAYLLNFVGEAMVRANYLSKAVIEFVRTGLYFYGISNIERFHNRQSMGYTTAHSELLMEYTNRKGLKALVARGQEKLDDGKNFCLVNDYLNTLKKCYWAGLRENDDACDSSVSLDAIESQSGGKMSDALPMSGTVDRDAEITNFEDRVAIMLRVFLDRLTKTQQRVYLMRHPMMRDESRTAFASFDEQLAEFMNELDSEHDKTGSWSEIALKLETTEKTVKRQYLRALHGLLSGACDEIFQGKLPSGMVRRMLNLLNKIIQERDLRIKDNAGLGLGKIVQRWEVALRFVLNNNRVLGHNDGDSNFASETTL